MSYSFHPIPGKPPCPHCGAPEGVMLNVSVGGYSVGSGFEHGAQCRTLRCPHDIPWSEECSTCNAHPLDEGDE